MARIILYTASWETFFSFGKEIPIDKIANRIQKDLTGRKYHYHKDVLRLNHNAVLIYFYTGHSKKPERFSKRSGM